MNANRIIFGEAHFHDDEIDRINLAIRSIHPKYILHELLYDLVLTDADECIHALEKARLDTENIYAIDIIKLCVELGAIGVGIDIHPDKLDTSLSLRQRFAIREEHMHTIIDKHKTSSCVVVVGDAHLRTVESELGRASVLNKFADSFTIVRSKYPEIE